MSPLELAIVLFFITIFGIFIYDSYKTSEMDKLRDHAHRWTCVERCINSFGQHICYLMKQNDHVANCTYEIHWYLTVCFTITLKDGTQHQESWPYTFNENIWTPELLKVTFDCMRALKEPKNETRN